MLRDTEAFIRSIRDTCLPGLDRIGRKPPEADADLRERINAFVDGVNQLERRLRLNSGLNRRTFKRSGKVNLRD